MEKLNQGGPDLVHFTLSFWLALPLAALVAAFFGVVFGAPTLRLRGDYLAIVTLGFGEIVPIVARNVDSVTNGAAGLNGVQAPRLFGHGFGVDATPYYYVGMALVALLIFVSIRLRDSRTGRAWMAIREDEIAAGAMGVDRTRYKLLAFAIGAAFAGMVGVFYVAKLQTATPEMFGFPVSTMILVMVVLGGMGSVWGVVLGAALLQLLQSWFLQDLTQWLHMFGALIGNAWFQSVDLVESIELIFGIILVLMMLFRRDGLIPATRRQPLLDYDAQHAEVKRGGFSGLEAIGKADGEAGTALDVRGVTVRFGGLTALNKVDLSVPTGGVVAVIGPNGSGKSTLFNVITGLTHADEGSIRFHGVELLGLAAARDPEGGGGAHVPEHPAVPQPDRAGERADRPARAPVHQRLRRDPALVAVPPGGDARAGLGDDHHRPVRQPADAARPAGRERPVVRQPPPRRDRPRARQPAEDPAAGRADGGDEPRRDAGTRRADQEPATISA